MYKLWARPRQAEFMISSSFDLHVWPSPSTLAWTNVSNGTSMPQGQQLCQIILKSMHKCLSYGRDKLNLWPFYHLTLKCELDLQPTWTNVSNGTSIPQGKQLCHINMKSINKCTNYGLDKSGRMHGGTMHPCMHIHKLKLLQLCFTPCINSTRQLSF